MVLGLVAHRVPRSGLGARRQTGRSPANSSGTVLLPYPRSLLQDVPFSSQLRSSDGTAWRERAIRGRGRAAQPSGCSPAHLPNLRTYGDARRNARRCGNRGHSAAIRAARINSGPKGGRCIGSTGLAGSPRRPRTMEGPLVSDTTELLGGAPSASEDAPAGNSAPPAAAGGATVPDVQVAQPRWHRPFLAAPARAAADGAVHGYPGGRPDAQGATRRGHPGPAGRGGYREPGFRPACRVRGS